MRTVNEVLMSVADVLFPGEEGRPVSLTSRSSEGDTALHVMGWRRDTEGARILIAAGADVDAVGDMDQTPLHVAIMQDDIAMARLLLDAGARTDIRSEFGKTAIEEARAKGGEIEKLLERARTTHAKK